MSKNNLETIALNRPNLVDYALARNEELKKSKADWVLFLDPDEKLSGPLKNIEDKYDGYILNRKNYFLNQYVGDEKLIRLGKKDAGKWTRAVHETWQIKGPVGTLSIYIIHNTATNLHDYINKIGKYAHLHSIENSKEGKKSNLFKIIFLPFGKLVITFIKSKNIVFSIMQSFHSFLAWSELWISQRN